MSELFLILIPVLLGDVANPVLFALLVHLVARPRGVLLSTAALAGHTVAYFSSGILIALAFDELTEFMVNPGTVGYVLGVVLGVILLYVAWLSRRSSATTETEIVTPGTPLSAFTTGAIVNFIGIPFGLPYFVAIDEILKAELGLASSLAVLGGYNLAYMLPFSLVPLLTLVMGSKARGLLDKISVWLERIGGVLLPILLAGFGIFLILDAIFYFGTGEGLY